MGKVPLALSAQRDFVSVFLRTVLLCPAMVCTESLPCCWDHGALAPPLMPPWDRSCAPVLGPVRSCCSINVLLGALGAEVTAAGALILGQVSPDAGRHGAA